MRRVVKAIVVLAIIGAAIGASLLAAVDILAKRSCEAGASDVIIVLGARVMPDGQASTTLENRLIEALAAYDGGLAGAVIVCGGQGEDEPVGEAALMREYLLERGVPDEAIYTDAESESTYENIANAAAVMADKGFKTAIIVTSDYHMARAMWIAADFGIEAGGIKADPPETFWPRWTNRAREVLSWINYFVNLKKW